MARPDPAKEDEMQAFFHQIIDQAQLRSVRSLTTGGKVEAEYNTKTWLLYGLNPGSLDVDRMYYSINKYAFPRDR